MGSRAFRFYKGEVENPFDEEGDLSRHVFWDWEQTLATQWDGLDTEEWFDRFGKYAPAFVSKWDATKAEKGRLLWMMDMCAKWNPYDCGDVDWSLYVSTPAT